MAFGPSCNIDFSETAGQTFEQVTDSVLSDPYLAPFQKSRESYGYFPRKSGIYPVTQAVAELVGCRLCIFFSSRASSSLLLLLWTRRDGGGGATYSLRN